MKFIDLMLDFKEIIPKLLAADAVVLVSSLYYFGINAQLKTSYRSIL